MSSIHCCCLHVHASLVITSCRLSAATLQCHTHQVEMIDTHDDTKTPFSSTKSHIDSLTNKYSGRHVWSTSSSVLACLQPIDDVLIRGISPVPVTIGETMHVAPTIQPYHFTDRLLAPIRCLSGAWSNE